jgi:hypothetical protein
LLYPYASDRGSLQLDEILSDGLRDLDCDVAVLAAFRTKAVSTIQV